MRILVADDQRVVRQGILWLLEDEPDFEVVGEAADGLEAIEKVEQLKPDVLITDIKMPGIDGVEVTRRATRLVPGLRVVVLSMYGIKRMLTGL
ncbi:MAG: response regulator transcription factor [Dehalococcoidia bacterium]